MRAVFDRRPVKATVFRAASIERLEDARCLHAAGRFQGAIYLCGYALECELKNCVCLAQRKASMEEGEAKRLGHELFRSLHEAGMVERLKAKRDLFLAFHRISNIWSTEIRYSGRLSSKKESEGFLKDSRALWQWLETESRS